jgi:hypothetical protein
MFANGRRLALSSAGVDLEAADRRYKARIGHGISLL